MSLAQAHRTKQRFLILGLAKLWLYLLSCYHLGRLPKLALLLLLNLLLLLLLTLFSSLWLRLTQLLKECLLLVVEGCLVRILSQSLSLV